MSLQIRPLSYALGAEIIGVDIRKPLEDKSFSEIHTAFLEHSVLLFRGQPLTRGQHVAFSRRFGELEDKEAPLDGGDLEYPEIFLNNPKPDYKPSDYLGEHWHTDQATKSNPAMISLLRAVEIPLVGGETLFANMYLAYETLSDGMKKLIEGLYLVHVQDPPSSFRPKTLRLDIGERHQRPPVAHTLVRVHPETGRKALFLTEKVKQLVGMTAEESKPLIQFLLNHAIRSQFVYRHQWQKDDLIMWDNRCLMHKAVGDYDRTQIRHMERTTVRGTPSDGYFLYEGPLQ